MVRSSFAEHWTTPVKNAAHRTDTILIPPGSPDGHGVVAGAMASASRAGFTRRSSPSGVSRQRTNHHGVSLQTSADRRADAVCIGPVGDVIRRARTLHTMAKVGRLGLHLRAAARLASRPSDALASCVNRAF